ncbi:Mannosylfructose-phosphate phosphatase [Rubripirellula reticaptiva]|uniref:Mannosylfructose-phosphate phosphatase n=2 Tax=Rubripirellula reticaptiva TaxID=2528013 RepID=A0A5C6EST0_9BACT|nr:Mannosylfructose-phosphate phosphatase [Rubripirellula reticaptiva]
MDGTFIPLDGNEQNRLDLHELQLELDRNHIALMYVTGRHLELVLDAVRSHGLPSPPWMICDVGASIYQSGDAGKYVLVQGYTDHLGQLVGNHDRNRIVQSLDQFGNLELQEDEKQSRYKISYYCDAATLNKLVTAIKDQLSHDQAPYRVIDSIDPFTGRGLIDLLPTGVSKAYALQWWASHTGTDQASITFAGDSGNDLAALTAGYCSIVVGNADESVAAEVRRVHDSAGWTNRLIIAKAHATSGVLEGLRCFVR